MIIRDALLVTPRSNAPPGDLDVKIASIGIADGRIAALGPYAAVRERCPGATAEIAGRSGNQCQLLALPGFVDGHSHSRQAAFAGYWDSGWRDRLSRPQHEREAVDLFRWFLLQAVRAGVTYVCDWPEHPQLWHPRPLDEELRAAGLRGCLRVLLPHNRGEPWPSLETAIEKLRPALGGLDDALRLGIWIPEEDKPEFNDPLLDLLARLQDCVREHPLSFQMHLAESQKRKQSCPRALDRLVEHGLLKSPGAARTVFAHAIWLDAADLSTLRDLRDRVGVVTCPKFADGRLAPIKELLAADVPVGLGSDVCTPDPFDLIRNLLALHRSREPALQLTFAEAFHIATLGGARVFGLDRRSGSIEEGKDADLVLVRNPAAIDPRLFTAGPEDARRHVQQRTKAIERLFTRNVLRREHVQMVMARGRVILDGGVAGSRDHEQAVEAAGQAAAAAILRRLQDKES